MGLFDGCLLACDIDGTLIYEGKVCERNVERIKYFISEGGSFSLASGRTPGGVSEIIPQIGDISPCVMANGTSIYDFSSDTPIYEKCVDKNDLWVTELIMKEFPEVGVQAHHGKKVLVIRSNAEVEAHITFESLDFEVMDLYTAATYSWNKIIYFARDFEEFEKLNEFTSKLECISDFVNTGAFSYGKQRRYHEQMPKGATKAKGIEKLCEILKVKLGGYFAIGDFYNDLEMIKAADIGAAVADAPEDVKCHADVVVSSAKDGAVADFIDYLSEAIK